MSAGRRLGAQQRFAERGAGLGWGGRGAAVVVSTAPGVGGSVKRLHLPRFPENQA